MEIGPGNIGIARNAKSGLVLLAKFSGLD